LAPTKGLQLGKIPTSGSAPVLSRQDSCAGGPRGQPGECGDSGAGQGHICDWGACPVGTHHRALFFLCACLLTQSCPPGLWRWWPSPILMRYLPFSRTDKWEW